MTEAIATNDLQNCEFSYSAIHNYKRYHANITMTSCLVNFGFFILSCIELKSSSFIHVDYIIVVIHIGCYYILSAFLL